NMKIALLQLESLGFVADTAANGAEVLQLLSKTSYDLIFMDCQMPEMDGFEATREIRRREVGKARVPIVAMTANALEGDRQRCLDAGMDDYVAKPVKADGLKPLLERWIRGEVTLDRAV